MGKKPRHFVVEEHVLRQQCVMFQALHHQSQWEQDNTFRMMEPDVVRDGNGDLCLPNIDDSDIFQRFCDFLYQGTIPPVTPSWVMELKLYKLADLLGLHGLMNGLIDALRDYHYRTNTHFSINQIRAIRRGLPGNGVWTYCVMGMAYHLARNLYPANDYEFDKLCQEFSSVSEATVLEVKKHGKSFNEGLDYRRCNLRYGLCFDQCKFHVHTAGNYCNPNDLRVHNLAEKPMQNSLNLGQYPVTLRASTKSEEGDQVLEASPQHNIQRRSTRRNIHRRSARRNIQRKLIQRSASQGLASRITKKISKKKEGRKARV